MRFSEAELLFLTTVTRSQVPFGLFLKFPKGKTGDEIGEEAVRELQKKHILDGQRKFTKWGTATVMLWESYCSCKKHLILNKMFAGITDEGRAIIIKKEADSYEILSFDRAALMVSLLRYCPFLCGADEDGADQSSRDMGYDQWLETIRDHGDAILMTGEYDGFQVRKEQAFFWEEKKGYVYDLNEQQISRIQPRAMRIRLMDQLGIKEEVADYG